MEYPVFLRIPEGNDKTATINAVVRFFQTGGAEGLEVVKDCIGVSVAVPQRLVLPELNALKEAACKSLLDPSEWHHKSITIVFVGTQQRIYLDENRKVMYLVEPELQADANATLPNISFSAARNV